MGAPFTRQPAFRIPTRHAARGRKHVIGKGKIQRGRQERTTAPISSVKRMFWGSCHYFGEDDTGRRKPPSNHTRDSDTFLG